MNYFHHVLFINCGLGFCLKAAVGSSKIVNENIVVKVIKYIENLIYSIFRFVGNAFSQLLSTPKSLLSYSKSEFKVLYGTAQQPTYSYPDPVKSAQLATEGKKYAEAKLKEIDASIKASALKLAQKKDPGRWPPQITEFPAPPILPTKKRSVSNLTDEELKGKKCVLDCVQSYTYTKSMIHD